jgi:hypothetical protein
VEVGVGGLDAVDGEDLELYGRVLRGAGHVRPQDVEAVIIGVKVGGHVLELFAQTLESGHRVLRQALECREEVGLGDNLAGRLQVERGEEPGLVPLRVRLVEHHELRGEVVEQLEVHAWRGGLEAVDEVVACVPVQRIHGGARVRRDGLDGESDLGHVASDAPVPAELKGRETGIHCRKCRIERVVRARCLLLRDCQRRHGGRQHSCGER